MNLRISLEGLKTLSFNCEDSNLLMSINDDVKKILDKFKSQLPNSKGLILRPYAAIRAGRALKKARRNFAALPKAARRGRHRMNPKYRMRVGKKAQTARRVNFLHAILIGGQNSPPPPPPEPPLLSGMAEFSV